MTGLELACRTRGDVELMREHEILRWRQRRPGRYASRCAGKWTKRSWGAKRFSRLFPMGSSGCCSPMRPRRTSCWKPTAEPFRLSARTLWARRHGAILREKIDRDAYHAEIRPYYENGIDQSLVAIVGPIWVHKINLTYLMIALGNIPTFAERIQRDIYYSTLKTPNGKMITGPVIFGAGTKIAMWEQPIDLDDLRRDVLDKQ